MKKRMTVGFVTSYILSIIGYLIFLTIVDKFFYKFTDFGFVFLIGVIMESAIAILKSIEKEVEY